MIVEPLPTKKQVSEWLDEFADTGVEPLDLVMLRQTLVPLFADGRLIDGQAIADAWNDYLESVPFTGESPVAWRRVSSLLNALTEEGPNDE